MKKLSFYILHSRPALFFMSLGIAALLWFFVASGEDRDISRNLEIPLELHNLVPDLRVLGAPETVDVRIVGSAAQLSNLSAQDVHAFVNLQNLSSGKFTLPVRAQIPPALELKSVAPSEIPLNLVVMENRLFTPSLEVKGTFSPGVSLAKTTMDPSQVLVTAPKEAFRSLSGVVAPVWARDLEKHHPGKTLSLSLEEQGELPPGIYRKEIIIFPEKVSLDFTLLRTLETKKVPITLALQGQIDPNYTQGKLVLNPEELTLSGKPGTLENISSIDLGTLDVTGASRDILQTFPVVLGENVTCTVSPKEVTASLTITPEMGEKIMKDVPLTVEGKSIYPRWEAFPTMVTVRLRGPKKVLGTFSRDSLKVFVDVTNLVSRKISVPVRVETSVKAVRIVGTSPGKVTVYAKTQE